MTEVSLLPGPPVLSAAVSTAFRLPPLYHRDEHFLALFENVRDRLRSLVGVRDVALFLGSGTLANEVVAATLAAIESPGRGLLLNNGEFGRRLVAQVQRYGLQPRVLNWPWGRPWDLDAIVEALDEEPSGSWIWGVHQESSTGVVNDLPSLVQIARQRGIRVCVDAVSSLGSMSLDLSEVWLASGTSGKALGSCPGTAMVFANLHGLVQTDMSRVPTYFDLAATLNHRGPRFTFPSPVLCALGAALNDFDTPAKARNRYSHYAALGCFVRSQLRSVGLSPLSDDTHSSSTMTTFMPPKGWTSKAFVELCRSWGYLIGGQSAYLSDRRLVQIATLGEIHSTDFAPLFRQFESLVASGLREVTASGAYAG